MMPFAVMDCALLARMSGIAPAVNLRELRDRIAACGEYVLFRHYCETMLLIARDPKERMFGI